MGERWNECWTRNDDESSPNPSFNIGHPLRSKGEANDEFNDDHRRQWQIKHPNMPMQATTRKKLILRSVNWTFSFVKYSNFVLFHHINWMLCFLADSCVYAHFFHWVLKNWRLYWSPTRVSQLTHTNWAKKHSMRKKCDTTVMEISYFFVVIVIFLHFIFILFIRRVEEEILFLFSIETNAVFAGPLFCTKLSFYLAFIKKWSKSKKCKNRKKNEKKFKKKEHRYEHHECDGKTRSMSQHFIPHNLTSDQLKLHKSHSQ